MTNMDGEFLMKGYEIFIIYTYDFWLYFDIFACYFPHFVHNIYCQIFFWYNCLMVNERKYIILCKFDMSHIGKILPNSDRFCESFMQTWDKSSKYNYIDKCTWTEYYVKLKTTLSVTDLAKSSFFHNLTNIKLCLLNHFNLI